MKKYGNLILLAGSIVGVFALFLASCLMFA